MKICAEEYLLHIIHERGLSANTHKGYQAALRHFCAWAGRNGYPEIALRALSLPLMRRYLYHLRDRGLRPRTVRSYFDSVKGVCLFAVKNGLLEQDPCDGLQMPKKDAAVRLTVSDQEVSGLLAACGRQRDPIRGALYSAVMCTLIYAALRRQELCDLRVADFDAKNKSLLVRSGKGGKSRVVFLADAALHALQEWTAVRPKDCTHDWLFIYDRSRRLHYEGLSGLVETIKAQAGYRDAANIKPHSLRHWRATDLLRSGADLASIQSVLGHTALATTAIYLHASEEQSRNVANLSRLNAPVSIPAVRESTSRPSGNRRARLRQSLR